MHSDWTWCIIMELYFVSIQTHANIHTKADTSSHQSDTQKYIIRIISKYMNEHTETGNNSRALSSIILWTSRCGFISVKWNVMSHRPVASRCVIKYIIGHITTDGKNSKAFNDGKNHTEIIHIAYKFFYFGCLRIYPLRYVRYFSQLFLEQCWELFARNKTGAHKKYT